MLTHPAPHRLLSRLLPRCLLVLSVCGTVLLTGCSGDDAEPTSAEAAAIAEGERIEQLQTWPLTGLKVDQGTAEKDHPVIVVKIDNTDSSAPQVGLSQADLVVEELVEGGVTRLATFFYEQIPGKVGPVRSMRASDIGIVSPVDADVVTSGAAPVTLGRIRGAGIRYFSEGAPGFFRDAARSAPYDLFTTLSTTVKQTEGQPARPDDYLDWGDEDSLPQGRAAASFAAVFSAGHTTSWRYADGRYVNEGTNAAPDDQFPTDSVLVLRVEVGDAGYLDPAGNTVPETTFEGTGAATLFHGGRMVRGTWSKKGLDQPLALTTGSGKATEDLQVPAGHTWIELLPRVGGSLTVAP